MQSPGEVLLVGAGPGDPGLITVKGLEAIRKADCIVYDRLVSKELLLEAKEGCELIDAGKAKGHHALKQEEINALLVAKAQEVARVVRLKGGDPFVFGRGAEEMLALREAGISCKVISGVTSAVAAPAASGIPVTHRSYASGVRIITAHGAEGQMPDLDFESMAKGNETCVFMMALSRVSEIARRLLSAGCSASTPAAVVSSATLPSAQTVRGTLANIGELIERESLKSPAVFVVGAVAELNL